MGFEKAQQLLNQFKGGRYDYGHGVLDRVGAATATFGKRAVIVRGGFRGSDQYVADIKRSLEQAGVEAAGEVRGVRPNVPLEDLARLTEDLKDIDADVIIAFGGGSTLDAIKPAEVMRTLGGKIEDYFGTGLISAALANSQKRLTPIVAVQTVASSSSHLTKYSNITNLETGQKKLIVDEAIVPVWPIFDYSVTYGMPPSLTADGALDGIAHCLEVLYGAEGKPHFELMQQIAYEGIRLVVEYLPQVLADPQNAEGREALGLATDLGGYAIMVGGTNGGHLTSFSLVDILSHGRACALMNPYYTVFFAPAIEQSLRLIGQIFEESGDCTADLGQLNGRDLGLAVAGAMIAFQKRIGFPTMLSEVDGFTDAHIERALTAAKNPQLKMKLENMPVALSAETVDKYMRPVLEAARDGDLNKVMN